MHHCCKFNADEIYYLTDKKSFTNRKLSAGYCPVCNKLVAELSGVNKNGETRQRIFTEDDAKIYIHKCKKEIIYSMTECNLQSQKTKLFGWRYGVNKKNKSKNKETILQYACDFYGNKEIVKKITR